jgi:flagellar protein FliL
MAKKEKAQAPAADEDADDRPEGDEQAGAVEAKAGIVGKLKQRLGKKLIFVAGGAALVLLLGIGAGVYFFAFSAPHAKAGGTKMADASPPPPIVAPQVAFYDMPDIVVNIQTVDGAPAYLKLGVSLELNRAEEKAAIQPLMPRVVDQFQSYLRELRVDDLRGSAGVLRLKEELLRRINVAAAPFHVKDVLLKEMIVQ